MPHRPRLWLPLPLLVVFLGLPALIELLLIAGDLGWLPLRGVRSLAYQNGAFWAGLLDNWRPNYAAQPWLMFLTYSFLHAGFGHLAGNMVALVVLMQLVARRLTAWSFAAVYLISAIGGGLGFALLGQAVNPMVGASGALFGIAGAWKWIDWQRVASGPARAWMILRDIALLSLLNLVIWVTEGGALAWEAHLGGFLAGLAAMAVLERRARPGPRGE